MRSESARERPAPSRRHCMVVHATYPVGETRVQRQALALVDAGFEVDVLCLRTAGEPASEIVEGVRVRRLPLDRHRGSGMLAQLLEYLAFFVMVAVVFSARHLTRRYHSVQVHNLPDFLVFSVAVAKVTGTRVILDLHDLMPEFMASRVDAGSGHPLVRLVTIQERLACAFADEVITVTEHWAETLRSRGVTAEKVHVVMNVADPRLFRRDVGHEDEDEAFTVIYHGTFTRRYGVDVLVGAVASLTADLPGIRLVLLGDGEIRDELISLVERAGLSERVEFSPGTIEASALPPRIASADVGVVPNRSNVFTDGILPTKLLEYVAVGIPTVVSDTEGVRRYFDDDMVEFVEPGDEQALAEALRRLAEEPERCEALVERSDEFNRRHSWTAEAERYVALVEQRRSASSGVGTDR